MTATATQMPVFKVVDLFCGAGGTTAGFQRAKFRGATIAEVVACVNHDHQAIKNHAANYPHCLHFTEDIRTLDVHRIPRRQPGDTNPWVLWASLECTHFSNAKSGSRDADSRTLAWALLPYIEWLLPDLIQIENVREFLGWGPLIPKVVKATKGAGEHCTLTYTNPKKKDADQRVRVGPTWVPQNRKKGVEYVRWVQAIERMGYRYAYKLVNSADHGSHQSRTRYFGIFAREGSPIVFPPATHDKFGRNGLPRWKAVREVLDLHEVGQSIFDRRYKSGKPKPPLTANTLRRLLAGLVRFVAGGNDQFFIKHYGGPVGDKVVSIDQPGPCITTVPHEGLVTVQRHRPLFLQKYLSNPPGGKVSQGASLDNPAPVVTTQRHPTLVSAAFLLKSYGGRTDNKAIPLDRPAPTVTTTPNDQLATIRRDDGFLLQYNGKPSAGTAHTLGKPAGTLTTTDRFGLVWLHNCTIRGNPTPGDQPCTTLVTDPRQQLVRVAFLDNQYGNSEPTGLDQPAGAITGTPKQNLCHAAFLDNQFGTGVASSVDEPSHALLPTPKKALCSLAFVANNRHNNAGSGPGEPAATLTTGTHHYPVFLLNPQFTLPGSTVDAPAPTLIASMGKRPLQLVSLAYHPRRTHPLHTTTSVWSYPLFTLKGGRPLLEKIRLFMALHGIADIFMRMLFIRELKRIQGLGDKYVLHGTDKEKKKYIGNAVVPDVVEQWAVALYTEWFHPVPQQLTMFQAA